MGILSWLFGGSAKQDLTVIINEGAFLVDVRSPREFAQGHVKGSVNIPLDSIPSQLSKFKNKKHIIVFCRSGNRSSQAKSYLEQSGFANVVNGGTVEIVKQFVS
ncbi:MAG: rhodanese-like domain-containing protein [Pedobacter sp.]|jgi:rhodanese-related sulfurtransferase